MSAVLDHEDVTSAHPALDATTEDSVNAWTAPREPKPSVFRYMTVAGTLRAIGGSILVLGLANFLLAGVSVQNDLQRFMLLLIQTGVFASGAFALQRFMNDGRGARLLLGIALLSVPAGAAVLGAMIYGWVPIDGQEWLQTGGVFRSGGNYPDFAHWQATSGKGLIFAVVAAALALIPTTWFAIAVMARKTTAWMVPTFLISSALLLVPIRNPALVSMVMLTGMLGVLAILANKTRLHPELATAEGRFVRMTLFAPLIIMAARTFAMYPASAIFTVGVSATMFMLVRWSMTTSDKNSRLQLVMYPVAVLSAIGVAYSTGAWASVINDPFGGVVATLVGGGLLYSLRPLIASTRMPLVGEGLAASMALLSSIALGVDVGSWHGAADALESALAVTPAIAVLIYAYTQRRMVLASAALLAVGFNLMAVAEDFFDFFVGHGWQALVLAGLASVVAAAMLEKRKSAKMAKASADQVALGTVE